MCRSLPRATHPPASSSSRPAPSPASVLELLSCCFLLLHQHASTVPAKTAACVLRQTADTAAAAPKRCRPVRPVQPGSFPPGLSSRSQLAAVAAVRRRPPAATPDRSPATSEFQPAALAAADFWSFLHPCCRVTLVAAPPVPATTAASRWVSVQWFCRRRRGTHMAVRAAVGKAAGGGGCTRPTARHSQHAPVDAAAAPKRCRPVRPVQPGSFPPGLGPRSRPAAPAAVRRRPPAATPDRSPATSAGRTCSSRFRPVGGKLLGR